MSKLFSPLRIKDIIFKNRLVVSPMCQYTSNDGFASDFHLVHLGSRAMGGFGLIIQEATAVSPEGRITPGDMGIWKDKHIDKLKEITKFIHEHGSIAGMQLAHAGRKASCAIPWEGGKQLQQTQGAWKTWSASAVPFYPDDDTPMEMNMEDIQKVIEDFKTAAQRSLFAGYKLIEIHAAHGYLVHQFLSPLTNKRSDNYGGSFENRIRLLLEIVRAINSVWPENFPLFVRISATDYVEGGWSLEESTQLAAILKNMGVDLIDCSSGGIVPEVKIPLGPGYQVQFSEQIKKETGIMTGAVGLITNAKQAEEILTKGKADFILVARASLRDPYFALHAAHDLGDDVDWPVQYVRAKLK